jgi:predicted SprT family Zn-dependent metalloprotease
MNIDLGLRDHVNFILKEVLYEAEELGIPVSKNISPQVEISTRAITRWGCCKREGKKGPKAKYTIQVALKVACGPEKTLRQVVAHEILHTIPGGEGHRGVWKEHAARMNEKYGYQIKRTSSPETMGIDLSERPPLFLVSCKKCGKSQPRYRATSVTRNPKGYRCTCGGPLQVEDLSKK